MNLQISYHPLLILVHDPYPANFNIKKHYITTADLKIQEYSVIYYIYILMYTHTEILQCPNAHSYSGKHGKVGIASCDIDLTVDIARGKKHQLCTGRTLASTEK